MMLLAQHCVFQFIAADCFIWTLPSLIIWNDVIIKQLSFFFKGAPPSRGRESHRWWSLEDRAGYRNPSCPAPCTSRLSCKFWPNTDQGSAWDSSSESLVHIRYYLMNNIHAFNQNRRHWHNARCRHRKHLHIIAVLQIVVVAGSVPWCCWIVQPGWMSLSFLYRFVSTEPYFVGMSKVIQPGVVLQNLSSEFFFYFHFPQFLNCTPRWK